MSNVNAISSGISPTQSIIRSIAGVVVFCALLFGGAGTFAWPEGWLYLAVQCTSWTVVVLWLKKHNPELLKQRAELWKRVTKPWDKAIVILLTVGFIPLLGLPGVDAVRYRWSEVPLLFKILGFLGILVSSGLMFWVLKINPYSSAVVEIQKERGHETITTGPYEYVRHPMYVGGILNVISIPLALGSLIAFVPAILLTAVVVVRTYLEDKTLYRELDGYAKYAETVKYRLVPGVW
jgi:protein-S-isoprenylcysteine O-methyltransferase Ste14